MPATCRVAILCLAVLLMPASATAQGFFESLFGFGGGSRQSGPPADYRYREPVVRPSPPDDYENAPSGHDRYRTLCVRGCDGYYFPISGSATRGNFHRDAQICRRSCGTDAKLYYHPTSSGDASKMVDLTGLPYALHPNAFLYRKRLVDKCACRPDPWSASEIARHKSYAAEEPAKTEAGSADTRVEAVAGPAARAGETVSEPSAHADASLADERLPAALDARPDDANQAPSPIVRPAPDRPPLLRASPAATVAKHSSFARPKATAAPNKPPSLFGFTFGGTNQKKLRWPGD
jgi:hypothetical protein